MYRLSTAVLLALAVTSAYGSFIKQRVPKLDGRIVGGEETSIEAFPYQVSLRLLDYHVCGGSIIRSNVVITAAHCINTAVPSIYYTVQHGRTNVEITNHVIRVLYFVINENYDASDLNNDVALVFLWSDIEFSAKAQPIDLASVPPAPGTKAVVTGWGNLIEDGPAPSALQQVEVEIIDRSVCQEQYIDYDITDEMLCAGVDGGGKDACQGDSGGPLVANGQLVGIVSWGIGCARPEYAGVYANVANMRGWIDAHLQEY